MSTAPCSSPLPTASLAPTTAAEELQLLRQVAARTPQAFETFYQRYAPVLRRFLHRRLPSPDLVDEVCDDVLLVAWQQAARFQAQARLSTWLCGIARHRAQKAWQRVGRPSTAPRPPSPADPVADPALCLLHREQHQDLARAVAQLPPDLRLVIEAAYYQAASCKVIAARLGCSVGTVQTRLFRARRCLRATLVRAGQGAGTR